jgi:hypothetical protein
MKVPQFKLLPLLLLAVLSLQTSAQSTQSAMYDAIALLNATNGVNAILTPTSRGYNVVDPLNQKATMYNQTQIPPAYAASDSASTVIIKAILIRNAGLPIDASMADVQKAYASNPFLKNMFSANQRFILNLDKALAGLDNISTSNLAGGSAFENFGGNVVNGVSDFLIKRAQEELSISVFKKLQDFIQQYPEFKVLFPHTVVLIHPIEAYDYAKTFKALKEALNEDMDEMDAHIPWLYSLQRYQLLNKKVPELTLVFASTELFRQLHGKFSLAKSLHNIDTLTCLNEPNNYSAMIHLTSITSTSLRKKLLDDSEDGDYGYFTANDIKLATHNNLNYQSQLGRFYLGLLYQQIGSLQFYDAGGAHPLADLIGRYTTQTADILNQFIASADKLSILEQQLFKIKGQDDLIKSTGQSAFSAERFELYNKLIVSAMQLMQPYVQGLPGDRPWKQQLASVCTYWPQFSAHSIALTKDISLKNYNLAVNDLSDMLSTLSAYLESIKSDPAAVAALTTELNNRLDVKLNTTTTQITQNTSTLTTLVKSTGGDANVASAITIQVQTLQQSTTELQVQAQSLTLEKSKSKEMLLNLSKMLSYIDLLASISQAGNSQEVETILESYALPAGSSRVKKESAFNISVNAYVGAFARSSNSSGSGFTNEYGVTAPIGFDFSWGYQNAGSLSLFAGLADLGSVIRYKLNNDGKYEQNINFAGLVSPSVHLVYGFGGYVPLAVGLGCQFTSPVTSDSSSISLQPHLNAFLTVDIPLFNLSVKKHKSDKRVY